jgi:hypothetical protein
LKSPLHPHHHASHVISLRFVPGEGAFVFV